MLAATIGLDLARMDGFGGDWSWDEVEDPIKDLLDHSDCDGYLTPEQCLTVAPRLRELVTFWDDSGYNKRNALELAEGMERAAEQGEDLRFQ